MDKSVRYYKAVLFVILFLCHIGKGLNISLFRTTLPDLRDRLGVATDDVTFSYSFKDIGGLVGSIAAGIISDRFQGQSNLFLALCMMFLGASTVGVPWSPSLPLIGTLYTIQGFSIGTLDSVAISMIASVWGAGAAVPLQAVHFAFTTGSTISPLLASPFLSPDEDPYNCNTSDTTGCTENFSTTEASVKFDEGSKIEIPYAIVSGFNFLLGFVILVMYFVGPPETLVLHSPKKESLKQVFSPGSCSGGRAGLGSALVILFISYFICLKGNMSGILNLSFTYATESELKFNKQEASFMEFIKGLCSLSSRAVIIPVSHFVHPKFILFYTIVGGVSASALLTFVGTKTQTLFWIFSCVNNFLSSPSFGTVFSFIDKYIILYAFVVALASLGSGLSGFAFGALNGYLYENTIHESFLYLSVTMGVLWIINTVLMYVVASKLGYRHDKDGQQEEVVSVTNEKITSVAYVHCNNGFSPTDMDILDKSINPLNGEMTRL